jgi:hypothetical protein
METMSQNQPLLSVVLATDNLGRVKRVLDSLALQTIASEIEIVLVMTDDPNATELKELTSGFHSTQTVRVESIAPLASARAKGVRVVRAEFLFIAETHAYPDPDFAEKLVAALSGEWSVAVPGFRNSNPTSGFSWAGFLSDYGAWSDTLSSGETERPPSHDAAFRRSVLLEFGDRLEHALTFGDELYTTLRQRGHRSYFERSAGIQHVNIEKFSDFARERYLSGVLIGGYRSSRWSWPKRILYAGGSPLIPIVVLSRITGGVREVGRTEKLPIGTMPALILGALFKAAGEARGYLFGAPHSAEVGMTAFEVEKLAFNDGSR